jgi:hypothetical protein
MQKEETKKQKEVLQNSLPDKDKAITDKTAAAAKAAENLNAFKTEHVIEFWVLLQITVNYEII